MAFTAAERAVLAALADVLIPGEEGMPSAGEAGAAGEGLERVLAARPDLEEGLRRVLEAAQGRDAAAAVESMRKDLPALFSVLEEWVSGAYFMDEGVRSRIGYAGQTPRPIEPDPVAFLEELLRPVRERGPIHRSTPPRGASEA